MVERENGLTDIEKQLYHRNILLRDVGEAGQEKLKRSRVLIVGLGGLGSPALFYLVSSGVGEIGIADGDKVELSNLQRQILHGQEDLGKSKTLSARETVDRLRPEAKLNVYPFKITAENAAQIISSYDFVIEATDNFESKFLINDVCIRLGKAFSHAGIVGMYGQTMTVVPGKGPCYRCVFGDAPPAGAVESTEEAGVLGTVAGVLGAIQATEAIKYLLGCGSLLVGRLLTWDALAMSFREIRLPLDMRCEGCGESVNR